jgi:hypothetical protein
VRIATLLERLQQQPAEIKPNGNRLHRFFFHTERYVVDFAPDFGGWEQFDTSQDAWYFGVWVHPGRFMVLTYCEGDWCLAVCEGPAQYNIEIEDCIRFYDEGESARTIDFRTGATTIYRQDRAKFLLPVDEAQPAPNDPPRENGVV